MGRWVHEVWDTSQSHSGIDRPDDITIATYTAVVDVAIVKAELRFNESVHPDEILRALLVDNWGSLSLANWPTPGIPERARFSSLALRKINVFLDMAEHVVNYGLTERQRLPDSASTEGPRAWAYARFPATKAAGGGLYRCCTFESHIHLRYGSPHHAYCIPDEGMAPPGLEDDKDTMAFVRALVLSDLRQRIEKAEGRPFTWH